MAYPQQPDKVYTYPPTGAESYPAPPYSVSQPAVQPPMQQQVFMVNSAPGPVIVTQHAAPPNYLVLACIVFWCCNPLFGIIAIIFAFLSSSDAEAGQIESARSKGKVAMVLSILGMVLGIGVIILIVILAVTGAFATIASNCYWLNGRRYCV